MLGLVGLQFVVLTFGIGAKLKSNAAPAQLKLTQKILSNCRCILQCVHEDKLSNSSWYLDHSSFVLRVLTRELRGSARHWVHSSLTRTSSSHYLISSLSVANIDASQFALSAAPFSSPPFCPRLIYTPSLPP